MVTKLKDIQLALEARGITLMIVDGEWRAVDIDTGLSPAVLPHKSKQLNFVVCEEVKGSPNRGPPNGYNLQQALGMSDLHFQYQQSDLRLICNRTRSIDLKKTITKQVPGAVSLVIRQFVAFHPEYEAWSKHGYWNLKAALQVIFRGSACRSKKMEAASETAVKARKPRGRPRKVVQAPVPAGEPANIPEAAQGGNEDGESIDLSGVRSDDETEVQDHVEVPGDVEVPGEVEIQGQGDVEVGSEVEAEAGGEGNGAAEDESDAVAKDGREREHEHEHEDEDFLFQEPEPENEHEPEPNEELGEEIEEGGGSKNGAEAEGGVREEGMVPDDDMVIGDTSTMDATMFDSSAIVLNPNQTVNMSVDQNEVEEDDEEDGGKFDMSQVTGGPIFLKPAPKPQPATLATQTTAPSPQTATPKTQATVSKTQNVTPVLQAEPGHMDSSKVPTPNTNLPSKSAAAKQVAPRASSFPSASPTTSVSASPKTQVPPPTQPPTPPLPADPRAPNGRKLGFNSAAPVQPPVSSSSANSCAPNARKSGANTAPPPVAPDATPVSDDNSAPPAPKPATSVVWHGITITQKQLATIRANAARQASGEVLRASPIFSELIDKLAADPNYDPSSDPLPPAVPPAKPSGRGRPRKTVPPVDPTVTTPAPTADDTGVEQPVTRRKPRMKGASKPELPLDAVADTETDSNFALLDEAECVIDDSGKTEQGRVTRSRTGTSAKDAAKPAASGKGKVVVDRECVVANTGAAAGGKNKAPAKNKEAPAKKKVAKAPAPAGTSK